MSGLTSIIMGIVNGFEWVFIVLIIVVLFFGAKKIPELARSFGKATSEFQKAKIESKREIQQIKGQIKSQTSNGDLDRRKLESVAETLGIDHIGMPDNELRVSIEEELQRTKK